MREREENPEIRRQPGQPLTGERGREGGGKPEMEHEKGRQRQGGGGANPPAGSHGSAVE
jgi:hypothetical protein